jgi:hypothetical protein
MKKWAMILLLLMVTAVLSLGCAGNQKETKDTMIRCPKCGAYFSTKEGADAFRYTISPPNP